MNPKKSGFSTRAIHTGEKDNEFGAVALPIYKTAPFESKIAARAAGVIVANKRDTCIHGFDRGA